MQEEEYMKICLKEAEKGLGAVAPNPLVACVLVHENKIIGKGFHQQYGEAHAEVNAIASVEEKHLLPEATLYVNLEPCVHHGKTPPCCDLIIQHKIKKVVIAQHDPNPLVAGKGIEKLRLNGIEVEQGILEKEARNLNRRFNTFHEKQRPYIILKWTQSKDHFIDIKRKDGKAFQLSNVAAKKINHQWRAEEQAIMIGTNTALLDNPALTVREVEGKNPLRIVLDKNYRLPQSLQLFDFSTPTLVFTEHSIVSRKNIEIVAIDFDEDLLKNMLDELSIRNIQSLIVEGGAQLLNFFLKEKMWDEARIFTTEHLLKEGVKAPIVPKYLVEEIDIEGDLLAIYKNEL